jgi:hypothetical protein
MTMSQLEGEIRSLEGVVACQITDTDVIVLVSPEASSDVVGAAVLRVLAGAAARVGADRQLRVLGGTPAPAPARPPRRLTMVVAGAASAAMLTAASVAAAVTGVFEHHAAPGTPGGRALIGPAAAPVTASLGRGRRRSAGAQVASPVLAAPAQPPVTAVARLAANQSTTLPLPAMVTVALPVALRPPHARPATAPAPLPPAPAPPTVPGETLLSLAAFEAPDTGHLDHGRRPDRSGDHSPRPPRARGAGPQSGNASHGKGHEG